MLKPLNKVMVDIKPSGIRKFFDIVNEMEDAISLGVGEPDFDTPWHIREEGIYSLEKGKTFYTSNAGLLELREEICKYYDRRFEVEYNPESEVIVTVGGSEAVDIALRGLINSGDEVIVPEPSFVCYKPCTELAGGVAIALPLKEENEFKLTVEDIKSVISDKTKAIILSFPNNPTGAYMSKKELQDIADIIIAHNIYVISDEIYAELTYEGDHCSIASLPEMKERTIVVNGFSKSYAMTGWRLGYLLGPADIMVHFKKIHQYAIMCSPTMSQYAAIEAMKNGDDDVKMMREQYDMRRRFLVKAFRDMGLECFEPKGAFYVFPSIKSTGMTSEEFATKLLMEQKVAVIPGTAFGDCGEGFIRCSYAYSLDELKEATIRIARFLGR